MSDTTPSRPIQEVTLRGCPNQMATTSAPCVPWTYVPEIPAEVTENKAKFSVWCADPATNHLFFNASEGTNPSIRPGRNNPLRTLHAFIADYDAKITDEMMKTLLARCPAGFQPSWSARTFSGGTRLVWLFEAPLAMDQPKLTTNFLKVAARELKLKKLLPGLDETAWMDVFKLYEVGKEWTQISKTPISTNVLHYWLTEATAKVEWRGVSKLSIPLEDVEKEMHRKFPGRWSGPFAAGSRGVVFFDPSSKNPSAAIVTEEGLVCFGQEKVFYDWAEIFGRDFIQKYQADKIGAAVSDVWYDGRAYYRKSHAGVWESHSREDFTCHLRVRHGMESLRGKGETCSEVDRTLTYVHETRRVTGVVPSIYNPRELLQINGRRFLNCAAVRTIEPLETPQTWGQDFPWLAEFLDTCFEPAEQKDYFLAWLQRFYTTAHQGELAKGHALFLVGGVNRGKTLLASIVGRMMGGATDASDFLNSETQFNKELLEVGVWNIDDGVAAQTADGHQKFTEMVKRIVANPTFNYRAMYRDSQRTDWLGRIIVTLNDDASSLRVLPALDSSIEEKVMILKFSDKERRFPVWAKLEEIISRELPAFARWLLDWKAPEEVLDNGNGGTRLGVKKYIHEETRQKSLHVGGVGDLLELVDLWIKRSRPEGEVWEGSASEWMAEVGVHDVLRPLIGKYTPRQLGRKFTEASRIRGSRIEVCESTHKGSGQNYRILLQQDEAPLGAPPAAATRVSFLGETGDGGTQLAA